jgi:hypothetical protein
MWIEAPSPDFLELLPSRHVLPGYKFGKFSCIVVNFAKYVFMEGLRMEEDKDPWSSDGEGKFYFKDYCIQI